MSEYFTISSFLNKYPLLEELPSLNRDNLPLYRNVVFRHELCHFVERELDKVLLPNFGFKERFMEEFITDINNLKSVRYFMKFTEREIRVSALEYYCPIYSAGGGVEFSEQSKEVIRKLGKESYLESYLQEKISNYSISYFWNSFHKRYALLEEKLAKKLLCVV